MLKCMCRGALTGSWVGAFLLLSLAACGSGDLSLNEADPEIVARKPTFEQVYPIFQRECIPCHTGIDNDSDNEEEDEEDEREIRTGADSGAARPLGGTEPGLESCQSIVNNLDDVIESIFDDNNMPPGAWPRLTSKEKLIIERWIDEGAASCN